MPLLEQTHHLIDEVAFEKMKPGVRIFNCARGGIIKESALVGALKRGKVASAGLDVYESEPLAQSSPLRDLPNVILTPHLGASTEEAQENVGLEVAGCVVSLLKDAVVQNAVNMPSLDSRTLEIVRPYLELGDRLGTVLQQITFGPASKLKITYYGDVAQGHILPLNLAIKKGYLRKICGEEINDVNTPLKFERLGVEVEIVQQGHHSEYHELIEVETCSCDGKSARLGGALFGKNQIPRIVRFNDHVMEIIPEGKLLVLENQDVPGIVGMIGMTLARAGVNIANMALSRNAPGTYALSVFGLDEAPEDSVLAEIGMDESISKLHLISCN